MAEVSNVNDSNKSTASAQSPPSKLPPIDPNLKNKFAQVSPSFKAPSSPSGNDPKIDDKNWVHLGLIIIPALLLILLIVLGVGLFLRGKKSPTPNATKKEAPAISSPIPRASPVQLPAVKEQKKTDELKNYFAKVSPSFKQEYMSKVPDAAAGAYDDYLASSGDKKVEAARAFYIYLNNPGVDQSDTQFKTFLADVKSDLEKSIGKPLF